MTLALPGGGSEVIEYTGTIRPKVTVTQMPLYGTPLFAAWPMPPIFGAFAPSPDLVAFSHWAAHLDRQVNAFWHQAWSGQGVPIQAALKNLGPGGSIYSVVSSSSGNNFCAHMTSITTPVDGGKPKVVSRTSGNCGALHAHGTLSAGPLGAGTWTYTDSAGAHAPSVTPVALRTLTGAGSHPAF
jgi:hypothetical protein